jgi:hypothetical protein
MSPRFFACLFWVITVIAIALFILLLIDIATANWNALVDFTFLAIDCYFAWDVSVTYHRYRRSGMGTL